MNCPGWNSSDHLLHWPTHKGLSDWCRLHFPNGPTPIQSQAWPYLTSGQNALLVAPTGTGKTLAGFLATLDHLLGQAVQGTLTDEVSCVYISPMKSLGYDIERSLCKPLSDVAKALGQATPEVRVGLRTGDSTPYQRQQLRKCPPHILVTTPESLSILLSQQVWVNHFRNVKTIIVDEIHSLAPVKRGSDLALGLERLSALSTHDPQRIGLSATCRPAELIAQFLVGPNRTCHVIEPGSDAWNGIVGRTELSVESLIRSDEAPYRPLVHQRLVKRLQQSLAENQTTVVFTNTRPMTERVTFLLKQEIDGHSDPDSIAAHHGSLDRILRQNVETRLKAGELRMVVSSTSLELGVDYQSADYVAQLGLPGSVSRCLQRLGRAGHGPGRVRKGVILASNPAELAGAIVTAKAAIEGRIEPVRVIENSLDVLCQNLIALACSDDQNCDSTFDTVRKSWPYRNLSREDFDACLNYLAGELASPSGAWEPEPGANPRWTAPRIWKAKGEFGIRHRRVARWFRMNVGTIVSEESMVVECSGQRIGHLESSYADQLQAGDRFVLDGKALEYRRTEGSIIHSRQVGGEALFPRWTSERPGFSAVLATELGQFREELATLVIKSDRQAKAWLVQNYNMKPLDADCLTTLWKAQLSVSEVPANKGVLIEISPEPEGTAYAFHFGLHRAASEALARAVCARMGRLVGRDVQLTVSDLGFVIHTLSQTLEPDKIQALFTEDHLEADVIEGLDHGTLIASRFQHTASTGFMVLKNVEGGKVRVGGQDWVSRRLYPVVIESCPSHPLIREARRETLEDILDLPSASQWLSSRPKIRLRKLKQLSPFTQAWIEPFGSDVAEPIQYETADDALKRLHERLFSVTEKVV